LRTLFDADSADRSARRKDRVVRAVDGGVRDADGPPTRTDDCVDIRTDDADERRLEFIVGRQVLLADNLSCNLWTRVNS